MDSEIKRYIEYLQKTLLTPGSERVHDHQAFLDKLRSSGAYGNSGRPPRTDAEQSLFQKWKDDATSFQPVLKYDSYTARNIFQPVLDALLSNVKGDKLEVRLPVHLVPSTDLAATPVTRSSDGLHMLFVGNGTSSFCNYWAKAFAWLSITCARIHTGPMTDEFMKLALALDSGSIELSVKLALCYRTYGTLVGFGAVSEPEIAFHYRMELLSAMEMFAVGHELGHMWLAEQAETNVVFQELLSDSHETELFCDSYGFVVSRSIGNTGQNLSAFSGAGALCFLCASDWCNASHVNGESISGSHPDLETRCNNMLRLASANTDPEQRPMIESYLTDFYSYLQYLKRIINEILGVMTISENPKNP